MRPLYRRDFLNQSTKALVGVTALSSVNVLGSNDKITVAVMGVRGRGRALAAEFAQRSDVEVAAVCDIDDSVFDRAIKGVTDQQKRAPRIEKDVRRLLDDKSIDAMIIATPIHWLAVASVWACQAGKDVYVEKPMCHNIAEGKLMVQAVQKYKRVLQVGSQRRSATFLKEAAEYVQSGKLGKIGMARTWMASKRPSIGHYADEPVPPGVDYNLWLGAAPERPFNRNHFHYNWHWNWNYGGGELANNGPHAMDMACALLGIGLPNRVSSSGGLNVFNDDHVTPDTQITTWEYPGLTLMWENRQWSGFGLAAGFPLPDYCASQASGTSPRKGAYSSEFSFGVALYGDQGTLFAYDTDWEVYHQGQEVIRRCGNLGGKEHIANFIDCMRTRAKPNAHVENGYLASSLCHMGNIAFRLRRNLQFDPKTQVFVGDEEANGLLKRTYRKPFVLPEKV